MIDSLLIPPVNLTTTTTSFNLTSLEGAMYNTSRAANYTLTPNVTIFAPNNDAFESLGPAITNMSTSQLASVLDYHVLPNIVAYSSSLTNGSVFATRNGGENLTITGAGNNVWINNALLLQADILIANGVLHIIDDVLNPQGPGARPNPQIGDQGVAYASASEVPELPFTSYIPCTVSCPVTTSSTATVASATGGGGPLAGVSTTGTAFSTRSSKGVAATALPRRRGAEVLGVGVAVLGFVL